MDVDVEKIIAGTRREEAWHLYASAFDELRHVAVQRHVLYRTEFDDIMSDDRVEKYVAIAPDGALAGLSTLTNDLSAMPLISPDYFAHRWPDHYAARRIWYLGFLAIAATHRHSGAFEALIERMWRVVRANAGVAALDLCARNESGGLDAAITRRLTALTPDVLPTRLDTQAFWSWELPPSP
ncbi:hypothetical protein [Asanoa iriomotensis]|uniref:N-acetyltransferase domain-containing protein n=1 Tax=Asanoa iriomotensis TaxID=234613 RepID=A0ABQ4C6A3_9ACTN|nr:hypothetical protein [Asanoa iriomotensis]GIF58311.1 hypothetical protein Air01nite_44060 [Asanoa iriomotensis]